MNNVPEDQFKVTVDKFNKMIDFVAKVRGMQFRYSQTGSKEDSEALKKLEIQLDKTLQFYLDNREQLHDLPF